MAITALTLRNFRSFRMAELRLRPFLLLVGRNAAGKSNLIHGFLFLRDIARSGLANAISLQGGLAYLQNAGLACGRDLGIEVESDPADRDVRDSRFPTAGGSRSPREHAPTRSPSGATTGPRSARTASSCALR